MAYHPIINTLLFIILVDITFFDLPLKYFDCFDTRKYISLSIGIGQMTNELHYDVY